MIHKTSTGYAEMIAEWRNGEMPKASPSVARITVFSDDKVAVWKYSGKRRDAAEVIGRFYIGDNSVATMIGDSIHIESRPEGLMIGLGEQYEDGSYPDYMLDVETFPDVVAY